MKICSRSILAFMIATCVSASAAPLDEARTLADAGTLDANVVPLVTARAFDRLYDELYGLFFAGDPRVPVRAGDDD